MSPVIAKQQFINNTGGWIGAVQIGVKGDETGIAVEPGGTVWLSEAEQILTANAPRRAEDNPFVAQEHIVTNVETGARETLKVTPLTPINEGRYVPANERYIPADGMAGASQAAATGDEPVVLLSDAPTATSREAEVLAQGDAARPNVPPPPTVRAQAAAEAAAAAQEAPSAPPTPDEPPSTPEAPTSPPAAPAQPEAPSQPTPPATEEPSVTPETPATPPEETAVQSPGPEAEETGAANIPTGDAPAGEYAAQEEVGTPDAPQAGPPQSPAPWSPGSQE